jgi:TetR/AcrR family transcriptional regulator, mexJK operon transcriptional repressor
MSGDIPSRLPEPPGRAVRRTLRGDQKSEQIRLKATELFLQHGYDGVSVDEIVRVVGGSKTTLYNHYHNKEGLFVAIVKGLCEDLLASFISFGIPALEVEEGLRSLGLVLVGTLLQERHVAFQRLIVAESVRFPALGRAWFESGPEASRTIIALFLEQAQRAGRLRISDPHLSATLLHDMFTFDLLYRAMIGARPNDDEIRHRIDTAIDLFLNGLASTDTSTSDAQTFFGRMGRTKGKRND